MKQYILNRTDQAENVVSQGAVQYKNVGSLGTAQAEKICIGRLFWRTPIHESNPHYPAQGMSQDNGRAAVRACNCPISASNLYSGTWGRKVDITNT